jgi:hypothetical protein
MVPEKLRQPGSQQTHKVNPRRRQARRSASTDGQAGQIGGEMRADTPLNLYVNGSSLEVWASGDGLDVHRRHPRATGSAGMVAPSTDFAPGWIATALDATAAPGSEVVITDADGAEVATYTVRRTSPPSSSPRATSSRARPTRSASTARRRPSPPARHPPATAAR